jgi:hypothetical protein
MKPFRDEEIKDNPVEEPTSQTVHDPVCHMDIVATSAASNSEYEDLDLLLLQYTVPGAVRR